MIRKLRIKFIVLSMAALFVLLAVVVSGMNIINYRGVVSDAEDTLTYLAKHKGSFPEIRPDGGPGNGPFPGDDDSIEKEETENDLNDDSANDDADDDREEFPGRGGRDGMPSGMSPETPYESRFFSVLLSEDGEVLRADIKRIASVDETKAKEYAVQILEEGRTKGFVEDFLFIKSEEEEGTRIIFLDCGRKLASARRFLWISLIVAAAGYALFFFVIFFFSKRIIKPVAESYEKQKRFITDAGHEIKTPLAIIKADADVLEMDNENNEWIEDIQKQTERLTSLTNDLVSLARMEEVGNHLPMEDFCLSETVSEEASAYEMLAEAKNKKLVIEVQPDLHMTGDEKNIRRLVNILMDNAMKYSPEESEVSCSLKKNGRQLRLSINNQTMETISEESLSLLFDRFYRLDSSRNSETGGHGIGLSMAKAITEAHGGKISAGSPDGKSLCIEVVLPA